MSLLYAGVMKLIMFSNDISVSVLGTGDNAFVKVVFCYAPGLIIL